MDDAAAQDPGPDQLNPVPFVAALVIFVAVAVAAFAFLRDDEGSLVRPIRLDQVDDVTARAQLDVTDAPPCAPVERAQVDLGTESIFVEFVLGDPPDGSCTEADASIQGQGDRTIRTIAVVLPEPIDDRVLRPGIGRLELPCAEGGAETVCRADP